MERHLFARCLAARTRLLAYGHHFKRQDWQDQLDACRSTLVLHQRNPIVTLDGVATTLAAIEHEMDQWL